MKYQATLWVTCSLVLGLTSRAIADWQFKSRPDLAPPRLNITIPANADVEKGYLFLAPFAAGPDRAGLQLGPRQPGPYIFRDNGDLIWSGYGYFSIWAANFQMAKWKGQDVLFSFEGDHSTSFAKNRRMCLKLMCDRSWVWTRPRTHDHS
jgi:hypothetical protein